MNKVIKNTFGNSDLFQIVCEVDMNDEKYLFSKMQFYINGKKICNENNQIFILNDALVPIKEFLLKYHEGGYTSVVLSDYITENLVNSNINDIFSELVKNQQQQLLESFENDEEIDIPLYNDLDNIYLNFEWEPLIGYMFHFIKYENYEWLFWDNEKMDKYLSQKLCIGEFSLVLEEFYNWANDIMSKNLNV